MQNTEASGIPVQPVSWGPASKTEGPLSTNSGRSAHAQLRTFARCRNVHAEVGRRSKVQSYSGSRHMLLRAVLVAFSIALGAYFLYCALTNTASVPMANVFLPIVLTVALLVRLNRNRIGS